jgi:hypothetical protein
VLCPRTTRSSGAWGRWARLGICASGWLELIVPVQKRIDIKPYGFYIGNLKAPVAQLDVSIRATKFLTITPSYMDYSGPASGLDELPPQPARFNRSYEERQFRIDGEFTFSIRKFEISERNMYVRRFRPAPADDINRCRNRLKVAYPLTVKDHVWKPFASYEPYYEWRNGGWNRHRAWGGVTVALKEGRVWFQPSYMWESSQGARNVNYLLFGLIIKAKLEHSTRKETSMSKVLQRGAAMLALVVSLIFTTAASAHDAGQIPTSPWRKAAPFPEPDEELYGVALNGKMYVMGGWDEGKAAGINYEYDPATDKWTQKKGMPRSAHHLAIAAANGKLYVIGGFVPIRAGHEFMDLAATDAYAAAWHRGRGDWERISSRQRHDSIRRSVDVPRPASRSPHGTA